MESPSSWRRFFSELKRRNVYKVAATYAVVAFVGFQAATLLIPRTVLPSWADELLLAFMIAGFPVALVITWAFELTPEGMRRTAAREQGKIAERRASQPEYTVRHLLAVFAAGLLVAAVAYGGYSALGTGGDEVAPGGDVTAGGASPSEEVVVVFPFRVSGEDEDLGQGMVDLLTVKLAGSLRYRPVDPRTAVSAWRKAAGAGGASRDDLLRTARLVGAGTVVDGSVVRSGSELVLTASVVDVPGGASTEPLSVRGTPDQLASLVDELAARLLALEVGEVERLASLTSTSLPAVRSWVRGRAAFRDARYREAAAHFEEAVETDSTFALAALDLRAAAEWTTGPSERQRRLGERLAWKGRSSLTQRDRAMLAVVLGPRYPAPSTDQDEIEADRRAVDLAPDSPDAWYQFGDDLYHHGGLLGMERHLERAADAFAQALALDSSFAAPLGHLLEVRHLQGDTARVRALTSTYLERHPDSELADFYRWRGATLLGDQATLAEVRSRWDSISIQSLWRILGYARLDGHGLEDADVVARLLEDRPGPPAERAVTRSLLQGYYLDRGHPQEAAAVQRELGGQEPEEEPASPALPVRDEVVYGAIHWDGDQEAAEATIGELEPGLETVPSDPAARADRMHELCLAAQWWAETGERGSEVSAAVRRLRRSDYPPGHEADRQRDRWCASLLLVMSADVHSRRETERRVAVLDSITLSGGPADGDEFSMRANLASVRALSSVGRREWALSIASRRMVAWHPTYEATRLRWVARLAAALGDEERAVEAAAHYRALRGESPLPENGLAASERPAGN